MRLLLIALSLSLGDPLQAPQQNRAAVQQQPNSALQPAPGPVSPPNEQRRDDAATESGGRSGADTAIQLGILIVMLMQGGLFFRQLEIMEEQNKLGKDQFLATFRPKLTLRRIIERRKKKQVTIEIANAGGVGVAATTLHVWFGIFPTGQPQAEMIMEGLESAEKLPVNVAGGSSVVVVVPTTANAPYDRPEVIGAIHSVYCFGYIEYAGLELSSVHRMGFVRRFNMGSRMWEPADFEHSAWEYSD